MTLDLSPSPAAWHRDSRPRAARASAARLVAATGAAARRPARPPRARAGGEN